MKYTTIDQLIYCSNNCKFFIPSQGEIIPDLGILDLAHREGRFWLWGIIGYCKASSLPPRIAEARTRKSPNSLGSQGRRARILTNRRVNQ